MFPTNWPDEQFWYAWSASQTLAFPNGDGILVDGAIEAEFGLGPASVGDQISFSRIHIRFNVPVNGNYTVTDPAGVDIVPNQNAGARLFVTEDIGVPQPFSGALAGRNGPNLRPAVRDAVTGVETPIAPVTIDGRRFLTDGAAEVQVTGSAHGTNYAEVGTDNPGGLDGDAATPNDSCVRTDLFSVVGMLHEGNIASPLTIDRTTYRGDAASNQIDDFATAVAGIGQPQAGLSFKGTAVDVAGLAPQISGPFSGALALAADGSFVYTPAANFSGTATFAYVARQTTPNLANSNTATVTITVTPVNDPPVALNDAASAVAGTPVTINVLANDTDVDAGAVLTVSAINGQAIAVGQTVAVANGTVSRNANGRVTFTAAANFSGAATFSHTVSDGIATATATVTVTVVQGVAEAITIAQSEFRTGNVEWRINGTVTVLAGQTLNLELIQINGTVLPIGTTTVSPVNGAWTFTNRDAGSTPTAGARVRVTSQLTGATQIRLVTIRR